MALAPNTRERESLGNRILGPSSQSPWRCCRNIFFCNLRLGITNPKSLLVRDGFPNKTLSFGNSTTWLRVGQADLWGVPDRPRHLFPYYILEVWALALNTHKKPFSSARRNHRDRTNVDYHRLSSGALRLRVFGITKLNPSFTCFMNMSIPSDCKSVRFKRRSRAELVLDGGGKVTSLFLQAFLLFV